MVLSPSLLESCGLSLSISPSHFWLPSFSQDSVSSELFLAYAQSGWFLSTQICFQAFSLNSH